MYLQKNVDQHRTPNLAVTPFTKKTVGPSADVKTGPPYATMPAGGSFFRGNTVLSACHIRCPQQTSPSHLFLEFYVDLLLHEFYECLSLHGVHLDLLSPHGVNLDLRL